MPDPCYTLGLEEKVGINHRACCYSSCPRQLTRGNTEKQGEREAVLTTLSAEARETRVPQARQLRLRRGQHKSTDGDTPEKRMMEQKQN